MHQVKLCDAHVQLKLADVQQVLPEVEGPDALRVKVQAVAVARVGKVLLALRGCQRLACAGHASRTLMEAVAQLRQLA